MTNKIKPRKTPPAPVRRPPLAKGKLAKMNQAYARALRYAK